MEKMSWLWMNDDDDDEDHEIFCNWEFGGESKR